VIGLAAQASELPDGWEVASFGELNSFSGGTINPALRPDRVFELYSVPSFPTGRPEHLPGRAIGSTKQTVSPGDVLVCKINPRINRVWEVGPLGDREQIASSEWIGFRSDALVPRFAKHYFTEPSFRSLLCSEVSGVGGSLTRAQPSRVAAYPVPVAPLAEQTRIADQLDTLLARIQACQDRLEAIPALLKRFRQAVLGAATNGSLTADWRENREASAWVPTTVGDLLDGKPKWLLAQVCVDYETSVRSLTLSATTSGRFLSQHTKFIDEPVPADSHLWLEPGDILVQRANTLEYVGVSAIFDGPPKSFIYPDLMMKCRPNNRVDGRFLFFLLSAEPTRRYFRDHATGTAGNMPKINQQTVMSAPVDLPPIEEQLEIVRRANRLLQALRLLEQRHTVVAAHTRRLAPLTLAKAFRGELVPQDPGDEPAVALLARIAAQRDAPTDTTSAPAPRRGRPPRAPKETATMTKSRQDHDVMGQPYLAGHLRRIGTPASAEALFKVAELPVADFYKQLAWEVAQGHVKDNQTTLEPGHAAG